MARDHANFCGNETPATAKRLRRAKDAHPLRK